MEVKKGDIWLVKLEGDNHSVQGGTRPGIISSNDMNNKYSPTVNIIPCSSRMSKNNIPVHVTLGVETGLYQQSVALVEQETTVAKVNLLKKLGKCTDKVNNDIEKAIKIQKGMIAAHVDLAYVNDIIKKIQEENEIIQQCKDKGYEYNDEEMNKAFLLAELIGYCKEHGLKFETLLINKGVIKNSSNKKLRRVQ